MTDRAVTKTVDVEAPTLVWLDHETSLSGGSVHKSIQKLVESGRIADLEADIALVKKVVSRVDNEDEIRAKLERVEKMADTVREPDLKAHYNREAAALRKKLNEQT